MPTIIGQMIGKFLAKFWFLTGSELFDLHFRQQRNNLEIHKNKIEAEF